MIKVKLCPNPLKYIKKNYDKKAKFCAYSRNFDQLSSEFPMENQVVTMALLEDYFLGDINDKYKTLENKIYLEGIFNNYNIREDAEKTKYALEVFRNKKDELLGTLKLTLETMIDENHVFSMTNRSEEVFKEIYYKMALSPNFFDYKVKVMQYIDNPDLFKQLFEKFMKDNFKNIDFSNKELIFIEFDIITPPQTFLIFLIQRAGYDITHVAKAKYMPKEMRDKGKILKVNKIFHETFKDVDIEYIDNEEKKYTAAELLVKKSEKDYTYNFSELEDVKITISVASNKVAYANKIIDELKKGVHVVSLDKKNDRNLVKLINSDIYNKEFARNDLGKFILVLYNMFNKEGTSLEPNTLIKFSSDLLRKCFAFKGLKDENNNFAIDYLDDLTKIINYFTPIENKQASLWIDTIDELIEKRDKLKLYLLKVDYFQVDTNNLKIMRNFMCIIQNIVKELFIIGSGTLNNSLIDFLDKITILSDIEQISKDDENIAEEINVLLKEVQSKISNYESSKTIRGTKVTHNGMVEEINNFLLGINYDENNDKIYNNILSFQNSNILIDKKDNLKVLIISLDRNFIKLGDYTLPVHKEDIMAYRDYLYKNPIENKLLIDLINSSLNILNTADLQFLHSLHNYLSQGVEIEILRYCPYGTDNSSYIENLLVEELGIEIKDLDNEMKKDETDINAYRIPFDLEEYKDVYKASKTVSEKSKLWLNKEMCYKRVVYNTFNSEIVKDYNMYKNNAARIINKAYSKNNNLIKDNVSLYKIIHAMFPNETETVINNNRNILVSSLNNQNNCKNLELCNKDFNKELVLQLENNIIMTSQDKNYCKTCSANCIPKSTVNYHKK